MLDEELRTLTASEPLTLEEEYEMQEKWQSDEDKLTFIILARESESTTQTLEMSETLSPDDERLKKHPMVGDVNIFLHGDIRSASTPKEGEEEEEEFTAEVEIMIAEPSFRRKGLAYDALQLMLGYATGQPRLFKLSSSIPDSKLGIPPQSLITRISESNTPSIRLFEKLGFTITKRVEVFQEIEMRFSYSA
ncbi:hypothetical protein CPC08DRAFT_767056 [Agrocybe pediades]|nr:hypothetical protein CPC08DRAFT_767056 [Agrocybe pediades]